MTTECRCKYIGRRAGNFVCKAGGPLPAAWHHGRGSPKLATIAKWVNEHTHLCAGIKKVTISTDRKIKGTRLRHPGKGRKGLRLVVTDDGNSLAAALFATYTHVAIIHHTSGDTYRFNGEVVSALHEYLTDHPEALFDDDE